MLCLDVSIAFILVDGTSARRIPVSIMAAPMLPAAGSCSFNTKKAVKDAKIGSREKTKATRVELMWF